jgi:hypothetical protein
VWWAGISSLTRMTRAICPFSKGAVGWVPTEFCCCRVVPSPLEGEDGCKANTVRGLSRFTFDCIFNRIHSHLNDKNKKSHIPLYIGIWLFLWGGDTALTLRMRLRVGARNDAGWLNCPFSKGAVGWVPTGFCCCRCLCLGGARHLTTTAKTPSASLPPLFVKGEFASHEIADQVRNDEGTATAKSPSGKARHPFL